MGRRTALHSCKCLDFDSCYDTGGIVYTANNIFDRRGSFTEENRPMSLGIPFVFLHVTWYSFCCIPVDHRVVAIACFFEVNFRAS